ncbi:MAG: TIGR03936 family radical SAM-associated protein [Chloroflexi bacterium]|nr:TIGR03936 family radical SAM-associated protein [Chloroflexota bacterium]
MTTEPADLIGAMGQPILDEPPDGIPTGRLVTERTMRPAVVRIRLTFTKLGPLRFIGHLDLARVWERAVRRARLPVAYTHGFTPRPRIAFAAPLSLGAVGLRERVDIHLAESISPEDVITALRSQLPPGCEICDASRVDLDAPSMTAVMKWASFIITLSNPSETEMSLASETGTRWARRVPDPAVIATPPRSGSANDRRRSDPSTVSDQTPNDDGSFPTERDPGTPTQTGAPLVANPHLLNDEEPLRPPAEWLAPLTPAPPLPSRAELDTRLRTLLDSPQALVTRTRDGKSSNVDIRPLLIDASWIWDASSPLEDDRHSSGAVARLWLVVRHDATGAGRPDDVATALDLQSVDVTRTAIGLDDEPAPVIPTAAP